MMPARIPVLLLTLLSSASLIAEEQITPEPAAEAPTLTKTLVWPDGTRYVGGVLNGRRSGKGTIFWLDGTRFVGQFENDKRNGPGTMILPDGSVYTGFFKDDVLVDTVETLAASRARDEGQAPTETRPEFEPEPELVAEATPAMAEPPVAEHSFTEPSLAEPSAEPSASKKQEPSAHREPSAEPSAHREPSAEPSASKKQEQEPSAEPSANKRQEPQPQQLAAVEEVNSLTDTVRNQLTDTVQNWAAAWSRKDVDQYLAHYADEFVVPGRQSRQNWETLRRVRINRPRYITIDIDYQGFELIETNVVSVFFNQRYQSDTYNDSTDKVLRLKLENGTWKIIRELSR